MATRREAREWAVQLLFQLDMNPRDLYKVFAHFWAERNTDSKTRQFTEMLVRAVRDNLEVLDDTLKKYAEHWDISRMGVVDRNVLRMAICEMFFCDDIPAIVSINEAVDIAKYFSSNESGKFVNGILDRIRKDLDGQSKPAAGEAAERRSKA